LSPVKEAKFCVKIQSQRKNPPKKGIKFNKERKMQYPKKEPQIIIDLKKKHW